MNNNKGATLTGQCANICLLCVFILIVTCLAYLNLLYWYQDSTLDQVPSQVTRAHTKTPSETRKSQSCEHTVNTSTDPPIPITQPATYPTHPTFPWIYTITPTYKRLTQVVDLTSLCQTLQLVQNLVWIVIEDAYLKSDIVTDLLNRCNVRSVHLNARNITEWNSPAGRGVAQRNAGLMWIRKHCHKIDSCNGSFYFMDDDNKYALRLFEEIRATKFISIWPVGYAGSLQFEGPVCENNVIVEWHALFAPKRNFPIDMAGFAVSVGLLLEHSDALFGYLPHSHKKAEGGWQETRFLENFSSGQEDPHIECRGSLKEVFVWHIKTKITVKEVNNTHWKYDIRT